MQTGDILDRGDDEQAILDRNVYGRLGEMLENRQGIAGPKGFKKDSKITRAVLDEYPRSQWWLFASPNDKLMAEIEAIRGVQVGPILRALVDRGFVRVADRAEVPGHPLLYGTTKKFLDSFGLAALDELPRDAELVRD